MLSVDFGRIVPFNDLTFGEDMFLRGKYKKYTKKVTNEEKDKGLGKLKMRAS